MERGIDRNRRLAAIASVALAAAVAASGCSGGEDGRDAGPEPARPAAVKDWTASRIREDPVSYAEAAIRETDAISAKLRQVETGLEASRQAARRNLAALVEGEAEARRFGRAAKPVWENGATVYPASVGGRSFSSREALFKELDAAKRTVESAVRNKPVLENQIARDKANLDEVRKRLAANASRKYDLERKADAARTAMAEHDLDALRSIAGALSDAVDAGLPDEELFAPPTRHLGDDGGASEMEAFSF